MIWGKSKPDPISRRTKALTREISELEAEIRRLDQQLRQPRNQPRLRSTTLPGGAATAAAEAAVTPPPAATQPAPAPAFEPDSLEHLRAPQPPRTASPHFNKFGAPRYDLLALLRRLRDVFRRPTTTNPELVKYLRTGSVKGLPTLRKETRIARNRFIALALLLFLVLLGILSVFVRNH